MRTLNAVRYLCGLLLLALAAQAFAFNVEGTVFGNGSPLPNVQLQLWQTGGTSALGTATTDASGHYSFGSIGNGIYDLQVTPPSGAGFSSTSVSGISVAGDSVVQNVVLITGSSTVNGIVRDLDGAPVAGLDLTIKQQSSGTTVGTVRTAADGSYSIAVAQGDYQIDGYLGYADPVTGNWTSFMVNQLRSNLSVTGSRTVDLVMPLATLSGRTTDSHGVAVSGVVVDTHNQYWSDYSTGSYQWRAVYGSRATSDAAGNYSIRVLAGITSLVLQPPPGALANTVVSDLSVSGSAERDLVVQAASVISGVVRDLGGALVAGLDLTIKQQSSGTTVGTVRTAADGSYSIAVAQGDYQIDAYLGYADPVRGNWMSFMVNQLRSNLSVTGSRTVDLVMPLATLSGRTTDSNGVAVSGVVVDTHNQYWSDYSTGSYQWRAVYGSRATSDAAGNYSIRVLAGITSLVVEPAVASGFATTVINEMTVVGSLRQNIILMFADSQAPTIVSDPRATGITANAAIIEWQTDEPTTSVVYVDGVPYTVPGYRTDHAVAIDGLAAGSTYTASVSAEDRSGNGPATAVVTFTTSTIADTSAPQLLSGPTVSAISHDRATVTWSTDEAATTSLRYGQGSPSTPVTQDGLRDTHQIELSGLAADTEYAIQVMTSDSAGNGPTTSNVVTFRTLLQPDLAAPVIVSGPVITDVTDNSVTIEWETDEPAVSGVSLNDGAAWQVIRDDTLVTHHVVRVTGLAAATDYTYTASSTDGRGNGPTLSAPASFRTLSQPDTDKPVVTEPLRVVGITHQSAVVQWQTDEPADSTVEYGLSSSGLELNTSDAKLKSQHIVHLTGLQVDTEYFLRARSVDAAGNVTVTDIGSFRTRTHPDTTNPRFSAAPAVLGVTDTTVTLGWETDEPTEYVVGYGANAIDERSRSGGERNQRHQVTLTGLTPGQTYDFAVDATDGSGNAARHESRRTVTTTAREPDTFRVALSALGVGEAHAVLGGFGGFLTDLFADTTAPSFTVAPATVWTTDSMVLLGWTTNELASAQVTYGVQGSDDRRVAGELDASLLHAQLLTNLQASTTYAYEVRLRDIAGNETVQAGTFTTAAAADLLAPVLSSISVSDISAGMAAVALASSEPAIHEIRYGLAADALTETVYSFSYDSLSSVVLSNLVNGTTYHYQVTSLDAAGNRVVSTLRSFVAGAAGVIGGGTGGALSLLLTQAGATVSQVQAGATDFLVSLAEASLPKAASNYVIRWYVDGVHVPALDNVLDATVPSALLTAGTHTIRAELTDSTASQLTTLRVSQAVAVLPPPTVITPDLDQFAGVAISITQGGQEITRAPEGAADILVRVTGYNPAPGAHHTLRWYLDGVHHPEYDNVLEAVALLNPLPSGAHTLRLEITDHDAAMLTTSVTSKVVAVTKGTPAGAFGGLGLLVLATLLLRRRR